MTWDGIPEHRNLHGDGDEPKSPADYLRDQAARMRRGEPQPAPGPMPPDPFSSTAVGAVAQGEMFRSLTAEGGLTEPQALYYLACLVQVGLAMQTGRFGGTLPPWPGERQ